MTDKGAPCPCFSEMTSSGAGRSLQVTRAERGMRLARAQAARTFLRLQPGSAGGSCPPPAHAPPSAFQVPPRPARASHLGLLLQVPPVHTPTSKASVLPAQAPSCALTGPGETTLTGSVDRERCQNSSAARWSHAKKRSGGCQMGELGTFGAH